MTSLELLERSRSNSRAKENVEDEIGFDLEAVVHSNGTAKASDFLFSDQAKKVSDDKKTRPKQDDAQALSVMHQKRLNDAVESIRECFRTRGDLLYDVSVHLLHHDTTDTKQYQDTNNRVYQTKSQEKKDLELHAATEGKKRKCKQHVVVVAFRQSVISYYVHFLRMEYPDLAKPRDSMFTSAVEKLHDTIRLALQPDPDVHHSTQTASATSAISSGRAPSPDQPTEAKLLVDLPFRILLYSDQEISALKASAADTPARREQRCRFLASANTTKARRFLPLGDQELKVFLQLQQIQTALGTTPKTRQREVAKR